MSAMILLPCLLTLSAVQAAAENATVYSQHHQGKRTASGEPFNRAARTAAHRKLPFGTRVRVTNKSNGQSVVVRINDRGPFVHGRVIDLSTAAAQAIGMDSTATVSLAVLK